MKELPKSVVKFLDERRNPPKLKQPWMPPTEDDLRRRYDKRHDEPAKPEVDKPIEF